MKAKLYELNNAKDVLTKLNAEKLPTKTSYWVAKLVMAVDRELQLYEQERIKMVQKYGEDVPEQPGQTKVKTEYLQEYIGELNVLLAEEIELTGAKAIRLELIPDGLLSGDDMGRIMWAIEAEE